MKRALNVNLKFLILMNKFCLTLYVNVVRETSEMNIRNDRGEKRKSGKERKEK